MRTNQKPLFVTFNLLVFILISVAGVSGSVLCFGNDGHVAVEFVQGCNNAKSASTFAEPDPTDNCGPCVDVSFQSSAASLQNSTHHAPVLIGLTFVAVALTFFCNTHFKPFLARSFTLHNNSISSLKTVVLLI